MIHYSCDGCGKILDSGDETRYKVKIETYIANDMDEEDDCLDGENLMSGPFNYDDDEEDIDDELENIEYKTFQFDLCLACYKNYLQNPISNKSLPNKRFSEN